MISADTPRLSVVAPLYCEAGNVALLVKRLIAVLSAMNTSFEVILVDDGSSDATWEEIQAECQADARVLGFRLSRNFGHQHALLAGLHQARGEAVISMDGDLQHPPETIPELVAKWEAGFDIVKTVRRDKNVTGFMKRTTSRIFNKIFSFLTQVEIVEGTSDFRLLSRPALNALLEMRDARLFLRGTVQWLGFKSTQISYQVEARHSGESKFSSRKLISYAVSAIFAFSTKPLQIGIWLGFLTTFLAVLELVYILVAYSYGLSVEGWASTVGILSLLFGVLFVMLGIIGTYIANIHTMLQNRPKFIISEQARHVHEDANPVRSIK